MSLMFSISGLRGLVNKDLNLEIIYKYASAFGRYVGPGKVVMGRDTRKSGLAYSQAVFLGLGSVGCQIIDLGIVPTPTVLYNVKKNKAKGGIAVTASHNPVEWNALKFISSKGRFLNGKEFRYFSKQIKQVAPVLNIKTRAVKSNEIKDGVKTHIKRIVHVFRPIGERLLVGVDAVNGAGSLALPRLLEKMGCKVFHLNCKFSEKFPRPPEPRPRNITGLCRLVKEKGLDLGVACDPDCDRLAIVDEKGRAIGEEKTLVLAADFLLEQKTGSVVTNLSTTALVEDIAKKYNCRVYRTKVGEANVVSKMDKVGAVIGGEGNGGVIYPFINFTRDALVAAAIIVKLMIHRNKRLSQIVAQYPKYYMLKEKMRISRERFESKKRKIQRVITGRVSYSDGVRITTKDSWVHVRPSQTEPVIRIIGEAKNRKKLMEKIGDVKKILG